MSYFKKLCNKQNDKVYINESYGNSVKKVLEKTKSELSKMVYSPNYTIEAFLMFADGRYKTNKEALDDLQNLGSYEFQNSRNDIWDADGYEGEEYAHIKWGDLADLELSDINSYEKMMSNGISKDTYDNIIKQIDKITF